MENIGWKIISKIKYVYVYNWMTSLRTWNTVGQLYFNKIYIFLKIDNIKLKAKKCIIFI